MADIYTHLRELGVAFSFFNKKDLSNITPKYFYEICNKNIGMPCELTMQMIASNSNSFNEKELIILKNALKLGNLIKEKFNIKDNPKITWVGCDTQSDTPIDLIINQYKFSLKEESFILENMGLYKLLNILLNTDKYKKGSTHIFKEFANAEFENWFNVTCKCLLKDGPNLFEKTRENKYNVIGEIHNNSIVLSYNSTDKVKFDDVHRLSYSEFKNRTNSNLREYVFSKWIKNAVEDDEDYIKAKKDCAIAAGQNIINLVSKCQGTSPIGLMRFFRIEDEEYYYAKTTNTSVAIYKVPKLSDANNDIVINKVWIEVPKSQLNFYTEIINKANGCKIIFRNELRYSHGQFNGTPEAKCYIDRNACDLTTMYQRIV
ncbi:MAG: hypothetical protein ACI37Z_09105 [Candidatus Gastranaerophilaceae bacterium]